MARKTLVKTVQVKRQGRRVMPALRRSAKRARSVAQKAQLTVGEIIAAAYDTVGGEAREVVKLVTSSQMEKALGCRIVFVR